MADDIAKELEELMKRHEAQSRHQTRELVWPDFDADCRRFLLSHQAEILAAGRMRVALEPFARYADQWHDSYPGESLMNRTWMEGQAMPTLNDARRASAALAAATPGTHDAGKEEASNA